MREILVVKTDVLMNNGFFNGFVPNNYADFLDVIAKNYEYKERTDELENDETYQQILPYVWIINPETKKVFLYKRSSGKDYRETRLHNKISGGVGGHIDKENYNDPIMDSMMRELKEEVIVQEYPTPKIVGYIKQHHGVQAYHFAVVSIAETTHEVKKGDDEMVEGSFYTIDEVEEIFKSPENDVEEWTLVSWPYVKNYLSSI